MPKKVKKPTIKEPKPKKSPTKKTKYIWAIGRRKTATARVRLFEKKGPILVNDKPIEEYFPGEINQLLSLEPFRTTNTLNKYSATIKVEGSGKNGQLGAVIHGLSRAIAATNQEKYRSILKSRGFLTRDSRKRQKRMVGMGGKARRKKQSPKR
jgi:small subunit ribosomal protein S9